MIGNVVKFFKCPKFHDERGWFEVGYNQKYFTEEIADVNFVQQNISYSYKNVARGLHFQYINPQAKLVSCIEGEVIDYILDLRLGSNTFGKYQMYLLDDPDTFLYVPIGFAHGFITLSEIAKFQYFVSDIWNKQGETGVNFKHELENCILNQVGVLKSNKEHLYIKPNELVKNLIFNEKDLALPTLDEYYEAIETAKI